MLLVTVTVKVPVCGLTPCGLNVVPDRAPTMALKVLLPARFVVLVGGLDNEIPDCSTETLAVTVVYFGVVGVKVTVPVDPSRPCT